MWKKLSMREKKWNAHYKRNGSLVGGLFSLHAFLPVTVQVPPFASQLDSTPKKP